VRGKIPNPGKRSAYLKSSWLRQYSYKKVYQTTFLVKCLNKLRYFINFFLAVKIWGLCEYKTLNFNISASRQNIKNQSDFFVVNYVRIMRAYFQASSFTGVGGE